MQNTVLISQDLSCVGQVSMAIALPILGACGLRPSVLPTAILSTHTGGFGQNTYLDLSKEMRKIAKHWQSLNLHFSSLYLGYLGKSAIDFWLNNIADFKQDKQICLIDPAMGDHGRLYSGMDINYVIKMRRLLSEATMVTPNLTEARFLLDLKPVKTETLTDAKNILQDLMNKFSLKNAVITGLNLANDRIGMVGQSKNENQVWTIIQKRLSGSYFGTGDLFASALLVAILHGQSLKTASRIAGEFVSRSIRNTDPAQDKRFGPNYAAALPWLLEQIK